MEENNLPIIKVYDVDYSFIIKNYLNPEMWSKTWTLFQYKGFVFTLNICGIDCENEKVSFKLSLKDVLEPNKYDEEWCSFPNKVCRYIVYSLKIEDVNFLKRKIYSDMKEAIKTLENRRCQALDEYKQIEDSEETEKHILTEIAEKFLDDNNVTNENIRDVYIENYIENNSRIEDKLNEFKSNNRYRLFTDLYLILAESEKDEEFIKFILEYDEKCVDVYEEVKEYMKYLETEKCREELKDKLEDI